MYILITPFMLKVFYEHSLENDVMFESFRLTVRIYCGILCFGQGRWDSVGGFEKRMREIIGLADYL